MQVSVKRIDTSLPMPQYQTEGAVAFDLYAREDTTIKSKQIGLIPSNLIVETPAGYMLTVVPRSSTPKRKGLSIPHGIGVIDQDYCGPEDEVLIQLYNFTDSPVTVERGERIGQAAFVRVDKAELDEVEEVNSPTRGGVGSTG